MAGVSRPVAIARRSATRVPGSLSGSSGNCSDSWWGGDSGRATRPVTTPATPDERVTVLVPVGRRRRDRLANRLPRLEPTPLQRQRSQHFPPWLDQVEIRRVLRLEDELPTRMGQA